MRQAIARQSHPLSNSLSEITRSHGQEAEESRAGNLTSQILGTNARYVEI